MPVITTLGRRRRVATVVALSLLVAACGAGAPSTGPTPAPTPVTPGIDSPEAAADAIREHVPLLDGIEPADPNLIGQAASWTADTTADGWRITFEVGWGDCPAGCIDRHTWTWDVTTDGAIAFVEEAGSPLTEEILTGLKASSTRTGLAGRATGGPTCPVERPGDPSCAPRLIAGVDLVVQDEGGTDVARVATDASGFFRLTLEPGSYVLVPPTVEGFMSGPAPAPFTVQDRAETWVDLAWDTGIR